MDFFKSQDVARHNTMKLVLFFILAVVSMIVLTNFLVMFVFGYFNSETLTSGRFNWEIFIVVAVGIITLVSLGSLYKTFSLSSGGARVAEQMSGKLIVDDSGDPDKQRLLNVVEEMAIAAGMPVPPVYLLEEAGINAFAAGHDPSDAVIGVTRGAIQKLTRDELQGVVAHEFSHILNGDMRLNIRLIGILHGILLIGLMGYYIMRFGPRSRNSKGGGGIMVMGMGMMVIGYAGTFFGNLIKAAVSRQREYLADAAAVQFTRNPDGIGGALIRIGTKATGGILDNPKSGEISHSLFCQGITSSLLSLFSTHPPLSERISRIIPSWDGEFNAKYRSKPAVTQSDLPDSPSDKARLSKKNAAILAGGVVLSKDEVVGRVGRPTSRHLGYARKLIEELPTELSRAAHNPYGAQALIYALVLDVDYSERGKQIQYLKSSVSSGVNDEVGKMEKEVRSLAKEYRLVLVDLSLSTLRQLTADQYQSFKKTLNGLVLADGKINLFEWLLQKIVFHHLDKVFKENSGSQKNKVSLKRTKEACTILLSLFSIALKQKGVTKQEAFNAAKKEIGWLDSDLMLTGGFNLQNLDSALDDLAGLQPRFKAVLLKACTAIITVDKHVSIEETELLRAVADTLDCPMPQFI